MPGSAVRAVLRGDARGVGFRDATVRRAQELAVMGWVRSDDDGVRVHAEGAPAAVDELMAFLRSGPPAAQVADVEVQRVKVEGHEQFAIRGVSAGVFVVQEHAATAHHFDVRLEVGGVMCSWRCRRGRRWIRPSSAWRSRSATTAWRTTRSRAHWAMAA